MHLRSAFVLVASAAITGSAAAAAEAQAVPPIRPQDQIVLAGSVEVPRGRVIGEVVVFSGTVTVEGVVEGDVVVFEGPVVVAGQVNGSVIAADGVVRLRSNARIGGDVYSSVEVLTEEGAEAAGEVRGDVRFSLEAPLAALGKLLGPVAIAVSVLIAGLALLLVVPGGADRIAETVNDAPLTSLGWGIVAAVSVPLLALALSVLVLGLPLGLALLLSLGLWWIVGLTWAAWCAGRALVRPPHGRARAFLTGWAILAAVGLVPALNLAAWTVAPMLGLGAMAVATWRVRRHGQPVGRHRLGAVAPDEDAVEAGIS
jgi:hypothetical protein